MNFAKSRKKLPTWGPFQKDLTDQEWLEWRRGGIGGSDAAVALGVHPYKCALDLYLDKFRNKAKKVENNATRWGHALEPLVVDMVKQRFPNAIRVVQDLPLMIDPDFPQLRATMDAGAFGDKGAGIIEAKTALSMHGGLMFKDGIPKHYRAQCLHYLLVTRLDFCVLGALTEGYREEFFWIFPDLEELEALQKAELELWARMEAGDVFWMLDNSEKTAKALDLLYDTKPDAPEPLDARGNEVADRALELYFESKAREKFEGEKKTEAENVLKALIGDGEELIANGAIVKWSRTARGRRFTVKVV